MNYGQLRQPNRPLKCVMSSCMQMNIEINDALLNYAHDPNNQTTHAYRKKDEFIKYARIVDNSQYTKRNITVETIKRLLPVCIPAYTVTLIDNLIPKLEKEINKKL